MVVQAWKVRAIHFSRSESKAKYICVWVNLINEQRLQHTYAHIVHCFIKIQIDAWTVCFSLCYPNQSSYVFVYVCEPVTNVWAQALMQANRRVVGKHWKLESGAYSWVLHVQTNVVKNISTQLKIFLVALMREIGNFKARMYKVHSHTKTKAIYIHRSEHEHGHRHTHTHINWVLTHQQSACFAFKQLACCFCFLFIYYSAYVYVPLASWWGTLCPTKKGNGLLHPASSGPACSIGN